MGFLENEHGRASDSQHARKGMFNESRRLCQVDSGFRKQVSGQLPASLSPS